MIIKLETQRRTEFQLEILLKDWDLGEGSFFMGNNILYITKIFKKRCRQLFAAVTL